MNSTHVSSKCEVWDACCRGKHFRERIPLEGEELEEYEGGRWECGTRRCCRDVVEHRRDHSLCNRTRWLWIQHRQELSSGGARSTISQGNRARIRRRFHLKTPIHNKSTMEATWMSWKRRRWVILTASYFSDVQTETISNLHELVLDSIHHWTVKAESNSTLVTLILLNFFLDFSTSWLVYYKIFIYMN